ncbi:hypothetical protein KM043_008618 [Ampulex compressa]|nr:hypothetical protein KM043_008618 [Ampulex compressa]
MMVAITEHGSADPVQNTKLAQVIEMARKADVSVATINNFLEKAKKVKINRKSQFLELRGPGGCYLILHLVTSNFIGTKYEIQSQIKKVQNVKLTEHSSKYLFDHTCFIVTEKKHELDKAMEDAIEIGAEDVECNDKGKEQFLQFKCQPNEQPKVVNQLQQLDYNVLSIEETWIPKNLVTLSEADLKEVENLRQRMKRIPEVHSIYDNIEYKN